jgi:CHASE3 domain sensor protein
MMRGWTVRGWTVARLLAAGYLLAIGGLLLVGAAADQRIGVLLADRQTVERSHVIVDDLDRLRTQLADAERGQRGFVITGNERYLAPYTTGITGIAQTIQRLRAATADEPQQQAALADLQVPMTDKFAELEETIALRRTQGFGAAQQVVNTDRGANDMARIEAILTRMTAQERQTLVDRERRSAAAAALTGAAGNVGAATLAQLSSRLESEAREHRVADPIAALTSLRAELDRVVAVVHEEMAASLRKH